MRSLASPCSLTYFPAYHTSGTRPLDLVRWIVMHDEEAPTARSAAEYFKSPDSGGSAHLCVDDQKCFRCLANDVIPWGARSCILANERGFHIEQAGYAAWSAVLWQKHWRTLNRAAYKTAVHCKVFGLPVQFVTAAELPVTTHAEITKASKRLDPAHAWRYTHTDPGPLWPRRLFMRQVAKYHASLP